MKLKLLLILNVIFVSSVINAMNDQQDDFVVNIADDHDITIEIPSRQVVVSRAAARLYQAEVEQFSQEVKGCIKKTSAYVVIACAPLLGFIVGSLCSSLVGIVKGQ